jgi:hypothetical protein
MLGELYPICAKCRTSMRLTALEAVAGCNGQPSFVSVYACGGCGRLTAFELPAIESADHEITAPAA